MCVVSCTLDLMDWERKYKDHWSHVSVNCRLPVTGGEATVKICSQFPPHMYADIEIRCISVPTSCVFICIM